MFKNELIKTQKACNQHQIKVPQLNALRPRDHFGVPFQQKGG